MKTLFIMRHAKSSWDNPDWSDFERPLNERGLKTAPFMGEVMTKNNFAPEIVVSSPAMRAKQTAKLVLKATESEADIIFDERIYEAKPAETFRSRLRTSRRLQSRDDRRTQSRF